MEKETSWKKWDKTSYEYKIALWIYKTRPTIYCVLRYVSSSGMSRRIDFYAIKDNKPVYITWLCEKFDLGKIGKNQGLNVTGCGMDMGFYTVYNLGRKIFPDGFKLKTGRYGRNGNNSGFDNNGGYALKHEWL